MTYSNATRSRYVACRLEEAAARIKAAQHEAGLMQDGGEVDELHARLDVLADCMTDTQDFNSGLTVERLEEAA